MEEERLISLKEAAALSGLSADHLRRLAEKGTLKARKIGVRSAYYGVLGGRSVQPTENIPELERRAVAYHELKLADASTVWRDGLNTLLRGIAPINGRRVGSEPETVLAALLIRAFNTIYCAFDLATRGYYPQALNLLRTPIEDWMAYWYLRSFPEEYHRFTSTKLKTPRFKKMLEALEEKHGQDQGEGVRSWINRHHRFSHVDRLGVRMSILPGEDALNLALGPQQDKLLYLLCVEQALPVIVAHMNVLDNLRRLLGCEPLREFTDYADRVKQWQRAQAELAGENPSASDQRGGGDAGDP